MTNPDSRHTVITEDAPDRVERRSIVINATARDIFDLLADPARHREIDGSGTVRDPATSAPARLSKGERFTMSMKMGVPYRMTNEVVEFVDDELIAWRHFGGHIWRYSLEAAEGGTKVTEEFDWRPSKAPALLKLRRAPRDNAAAIEKTLIRLAQRFEADSK